jgi:hypothetical protein
MPPARVTEVIYLSNNLPKTKTEKGIAGSFLETKANAGAYGTQRPNSL